MKIVKHIPNTITSMNLVCGVLGIISVFCGHSDQAFLLMIAASVFDFCDGLAARLLGAYSPMGKELDSLCDMVSFGVLPSLMLFELVRSLQGGMSVWCFFPLLIAVFSALRLAKFNIDDRQSENFIGLPTPACAMICGALAYYITKDSDSFLHSWCGGKIFIPVLSCILSYLLISEHPMFSMKFKKGEKSYAAIHKMRIAFIGVMLVTSVFVLLLGLNWSMIILFSFLVYIIMNLLHDAFGDK